MANLDGKVALVTGASKGIGAAIAKALAEHGAAVVVNYASSREGAEAVVSAITGAGGKAIAVHGDVSKAADAQGLVDAAVREFGALDILVNNSGVYGFAGIEAVTEEDYRRMFDINVLGVLLMTKAAVPHLREGGSVINVGSVVTTAYMPETSVYTATKAAVDAMAPILAKELGPRGIRVNTIAPGMVETEGTHTAGISGSEMETAVVSQTPLGRVGQPEDIARVAVFLASDEAGWVSGERLAAGGGMR